MFYSFLFFIAGLIDSVAGGGGLITVPIFSLILGPGVSAIATNKIIAVGVTAAALWVYAKSGSLKVKENLPFLIAVLVGTVSGACLASLASKEGMDIFVKYALTAVSPVIIFVTFKKDMFVPTVRPNPAALWLLLLTGFLCGLYDGCFGPGGGTWMFLSLNWLAGRSLMESLAIAKLSNFLSASGSLVSYSAMGLVRWEIGLVYLLPVVLGGYFGARLVTKNAQKVVRPALVIVVVLLLIRLWWFN